MYKPKNRSRIETFNRSDKFELINYVRQKTELWDITDRRHTESFSVNSAWQMIAHTMGKDVVQCRKAWHSLRDSYRYQQKQASRRGSSQLEWEFAEAMSFVPLLKDRILETHILPSTSEKRRRLTEEEFIIEELDPLSDAEVEDDVDETQHLSATETCELDSSESLVQSQKKRVTRRSAATQEKPSAQMSRLFAQLLEQQQQLLALPSTAAEPSSTLQHHEMFAFWDTILTEMPPAAIQEAKFKVTALLHQIYDKYLPTNGEIIQIKQQKF